MKRLFMLISSLILLVVSTSISVFAQGNVVQVTTAEVESIPASEDEQPQIIDSGEATLYTDENGATMVLETSELEPGHVYTAWWVIINNPTACTSEPCSPDDVIGNADGVGTQITFADGLIVGEDGSAIFAGHLSAGEVENGWYQQEFEDPFTAEIHIVINHHGPMIADLLVSMLSSYRGGCSDESLPPPFPETAKLDGEPGPNACVLVQDAIFMQSSE